VPVLGPGDIALAAVEVEVEDLSADTIATVTPVLTLAAHGLTRELHPSWRRNTRAPHAPSGEVDEPSSVPASGRRPHVRRAAAMMSS
jgi:hypothetical protein